MFTALLGVNYIKNTKVVAIFLEKKNDIVDLSSTCGYKILAQKDTHTDMVATLDDASALSTVLKWGAVFRVGKKILKDDPCFERHVTVTTEENNDRFQHVVIDDRLLTINLIANAISVSHDRV